MKRWLLILALILPFAFPLAAQNVRFDLPIYTTQAQGGNLLPVYAIPGAGIKFYSCSGSTCTTLATTYISATSSTTCPVSPTPMQVTLNGSSTCVSSADPYGNMGGWFQPGQYMATITAQGASYNYYFTVGVGPGGVGCFPNTIANGCTGATTAAQAATNLTNDYYCPVGGSASACYAAACTIAGSGSAVTAHFPSGNWNIATPIALCSGVKTLGVVPRLVDCSPNLASCESPNGGTWFDCVTACFDTPGGGSSGVNNVSFEDVGFAEWTGTAITFGSSTTVGLNSGYFHNVYFYGTPGAGGDTGDGPSDKGIVCYNCQIVPGDNVTMINVNTGVSFPSAGSTGSIPGNAVWTGLVVQTYCKSAANGNNTEPAIDVDANQMTFVRPQVNTYCGDKTGDAILLEPDANSTTFIGTDGEVTNLNLLHIQSSDNHIEIPECFGVGSTINTVVLDSGSSKNYLWSGCLFASIVDNSGNAGNEIEGDWTNNSTALITEGMHFDNAGPQWHSVIDNTVTRQVTGFPDSLTLQGSGTIATMTIDAPGTGWAVNDLFRIYPTSGCDATGEVTAESGGIPSAISIAYIGTECNIAAGTGVATSKIGASVGTGLTVTTTVSIGAVSFGQPFTSGSIEFNPNPFLGIFPFSDNVSLNGIPGNAWTESNTYLDCIDKSTTIKGCFSGFNLTADRSYLLPDAGGTLALTSGVVTAINSTAGAFTFTGPGVSCTSTTCTFSGSGSGSAVTVNGGSTLSTANFLNNTGAGEIDFTNPSGPTVNATLANTATTVNGQTCTLGSTCTVPFETNGSGNTSQAGINLDTSTANSVGLTVTPTNSATNVEKFEVTGGSYTGNAATATSAAKWTTARNLAGNSVDGSANVAFANKFIVQGTTDSGLSGAQFLGALGTGILKNTTTTGVLSIAAAGTDYQSPLGLLEGTYVDGDLCSYTASGTLLNCNTAPGGTGNMSDGSGTSSSNYFPLTNGTTHDYTPTSPSATLAVLGAAPANGNQTPETSSFSATCPGSYRINSGTVTVTLPSAGTTGCLIAVQNVSTTAATISSGTVTLNGPTSLAQYQSILIQFDGTNFNGSYPPVNSALNGGPVGAAQGGTGTTSLTGIRYANGGSADTAATSANLLGVCTTCVVASSPGAGVAHFAGSTQTVTSSPVALASDVSGQLPIGAVGSAGLSGSGGVSIASTGAISLSGIPISSLATIGANTTLANVTGSTAVPTAATIPAGVQFYTAGTGYGAATSSQILTACSGCAPLASPTFTGTVTYPLIATTTYCAGVGTAASPSVASCSAAPSGFFSCATNASAATCIVNTSAVTANSVIQIQPDSSLGTALSVTCNTTADSALTAPRISARSAGTSFTLTMGTFTTNPECFSYLVIN